MLRVDSVGSRDIRNHILSDLSSNNDTWIFGNLRLKMICFDQGFAKDCLVVVI